MKLELREKARCLRRDKGLSLNEIVSILGCSKSSASLWVRDVELNHTQLARLEAHIRKNSSFAQKLGTLGMQEKHRKIREEAFQIGVDRLPKDHLFGIICALYWGEGTKSKNAFELSNCDSKLLELICKWLIVEGYDNRIKFTVVYCDPSLRIDEVKKYWLDQIPSLKDIHIGRIVLKNLPKSSLGKMARLHKQPYGTARIGCYDYKLFNQVMGGIQSLTQISVSKPSNNQTTSKQL